MAISSPSARRNFRPAVDGLESRELLSSMPMVSAAASHARHATPIIAQLASATPTSVSTIPANGDLNPYGVAFVPNGFPGGGPLHPGDVLVSNFNASSNFQGTGTTIVKISPDGTQSLFFQGPSGLGLTTALGVLKSGFVIVGSVPTTDGTSATVQQGSLLILDRTGKVVTTL